MKMTSAVKIRAIDAAKRAAAEYCKSNRLSLEKLSSQEYYYFGDLVSIMQTMPYNGGGLSEDLASQPKPTLTFDVINNIITPTEFTEQYLA